MIVNNVGYNHCHDADFFIERPDGSGDYLLLLLKSDTIFNIAGQDILVPENSFFLYKKDVPQFYRCVPQHSFSNDWIHFLFEEGEEEKFLSYGIPYNTPIKLDNINFLSFCVKSIAYETYSHNMNKQKSVSAYLDLMFLKIEEEICQKKVMIPDSKFEMLSTIRNKIYSKPYELRTIDWASHEVRMSRSSFQHLYKKQFGISFMQDLINSRVSYAKMLLESTNLSIVDISTQCGYRNYTHFVRQFKQSTSITPSEYRQKNQK